MKLERTLPRLSSALPALLLVLGLSLSAKVAWRLVTTEARPQNEATASRDSHEGRSGTPVREREAPAEIGESVGEALGTVSSAYLPLPEISERGALREETSHLGRNTGALRHPAPDESRPPGFSLEEPPYAPRGPPFVTA